MRRLTPPSESDSARTPKACLPCARAKARCEIEAGDETCKRCRRLKKVCSGQVPGAHRRKKVKPSEVARLEEKLDGVAAILAASQQIPNGVGASPASNPADFAPAAWIDQFITSDSEAEMMLQSFCSEMAPLFPFVVILPSMTFIELRDKKPFLLLAILMLGFRHDQVRQTAIAKKIREIISYNVLIKGEQSLDILQCLLVYLNWYHFHLHLGSQVCNLVHLVMAMMTDLRLNRGVCPKSLKPSFGNSGYFGKDGPVPLVMLTTNRAAPNSSTTRTLEERRTFLGCFFLISIVSMCVRDIDPIRYSTYVDECCRAISEAAEYPTDIYVVHLTHLHGLADRITRTLISDEWHMTPAFTSAPIGACVKSFESELRQVRSSLPEGAHQNAVLLIHYYAIEIFLYETALNDNIDALRYGMYPFARLNMLYACLNSTRLCFDTAYALPLSEWFHLPYTMWTLMGHAIVVLSRLSLFRAEGWDQEYIRSILDFSGVMDTLVRKLDEAKALAEKPSRPLGDNALPRVVLQPFSTLSTKLQWIKAAHEAKYAAQTSKSDQIPDLSSAETVVMPTDDEFAMPPTTPFFEFLDDNFWQQFS